MDILSRIQTKILELKPFIMEHGGDIEFVSFDNGLVKIKLTGACVGCPMSFYTLKLGVEQQLKEAISEVVSVDLV